MAPLMVSLFSGFALLTVLVGGQYLLLKWHENKAKKLRLVGEGIYEKVLSKSAPIAGGRLFTLKRITVDTVFFRDGKICPTMGVTKNLPEPGTKIRIYKNGLGEFKLEEVR